MELFRITILVETYLFVIIGLNLVSLTILYFKFNFRFSALLIFHLLLMSILLFVIGNFVDIFYYPNYPPSEDSKLNLKIIVLSGLLIPYFLALIFSYPIFGDLTEKLTSYTRYYGLALSVFTFTELIDNNGIHIKLMIMNNEWLFDFSPIFLLLILIFAILTSWTILSGIRNTNLKEDSTLNHPPIISFVIGFFLIILALFYDETITTPAAITIFLTGLIFILIGIFIIFINILKYPMTTIFLRNSTRALFINDFVDWVLYTNREMGPDVELQSESMNNKTEISYAEIFQFGVQSLMTAYNDNRFIENTSITPFSARDDFFALSISFTCIDETLKDHRFKNRLQSVLTIIIPTNIFSKFVQPVKNLNKINIKIQQLQLSEKNIGEIKTYQYLLDLSIECLNILI